MRICAFSDWRVQSIEALIEYLRRMDKKPDIIVYAGDDISRFNKIPEENIPDKLIEPYLESSPQKNYFEEIASLSRHGLCAVAGNDDLPFVRYAIRGKNVYNLHEKPLVVGRYAFIGLEGATKPPGLLLYSEEQVRTHLSRMLRKVPCDKKIIVVSHTPPRGLLDIGIRFGISRIGSTALRKFIDRQNKRVKLVICGHAHSQGGRAEVYKNTWIINCASHDYEDEPGKLAIIDISNKNTNIFWDLIYSSPVLKELDELLSVPLVGYSRAKALLEAGIKSVKQLSKLSPHHELSKNPLFRSSFELIINYAKAIVMDKPIVVGQHPFFKDVKNKNVFFFDAEYDPNGTRDGPFGIFLLGIMNCDGKVTQLFLDDPKHEKRMMKQFIDWVSNEKPILITYSSTSADRPQIVGNLKRLNLPTAGLKNAFFDLHYDCINTQRKGDQYIFLPMRGSMRLEDVSQYFGYKEQNSSIQNGFHALIKYHEFLEANDRKVKNKIKKELLAYNKADLERVKCVFEGLKKLMKKAKASPNKEHKFNQTNLNNRSAIFTGR